MTELSGNGVHTSSDLILVVEDNRLNQKVAMLLLSKLGKSVDTAMNGLEALQAVTRQRYSLILMDCHMPEMDGFEATVAIRQLEAQTGFYTPIIAVTALTTAADKQRCLDAGMDDYIPKPIERDILKAKIDHWILMASAMHNPGSAAIFRESINAGDQTASDVDEINFPELKDFYGEVQLSQMLSFFIAETATKLGQIDTFIRHRNVGAVTLLTGELKASCATIGARQLARLCLHLQMAVAKLDWVEATETFTSIQRSFSKGRMLLQAGVKTEENPVITDDMETDTADHADDLSATEYDSRRPHG